MSNARLIEVDFNVILKGDYRMKCIHPFFKFDNIELKSMISKPMHLNKFLSLISTFPNGTIKSILKDARWFIYTKDNDALLYKHFDVPLPKDFKRSTPSKGDIYRHFRGEWVEVLEIKSEGEILKIIFKSIKDKHQWNMVLESFLCRIDRTLFCSKEPYRFMTMNEIESLISDDGLITRVRNEYLYLKGDDINGQTKEA